MTNRTSGAKSARGAMNGRRYSESEKAIAVQAVRSLGGVVTVEVWRNVQSILKSEVSFDTLRLWLKSYREPKSDVESTESRTSSTEPVEAIDFAHAATLEIVEHTFRKYATRANNQTAVDVTEGKDAARVMADMLKLLQLLQGLPTEIVSVMPELMAAAKRRNVDAVAIVRELINEMDSAEVEAGE